MCKSWDGTRVDLTFEECDKFVAMNVIDYLTLVTRAACR